MKKSQRKSFNAKSLLLGVLLVCSQLTNTQKVDFSLQTDHQSKTQDLRSEGQWTLTKLKAKKGGMNPSTAQRRLLPPPPPPPGCGLSGRRNSNCDQICSTNCLECWNTSSNNCSSCIYGFYETSNNCDNTCGTLPANCISCGDRDCIACKAGYSLRANADRCCPDGQVWNSSYCQDCTAYYSDCATCTIEGGGVGHMECLSCFPGYYLTNDWCCREGTYLSNSGCSACHASCRQCRGPDYDDCLACYGTQTLSRHESGNRMVCCPAGTGHTGSYGQWCDGTCTGGCATCYMSFFDRCHTCTDTTNSVVPNLANDQDTLHHCCPAQQYHNGTTCAACDSSCQACSGRANYCTACSWGKLLTQKGTCVICDTTCSGSAGCVGTTTNCICNGNNYWTGTACAACNSNCLTCMLTATKCTSCAPGRFLNPTTRSCDLCHANCSTCTRTATECITCSNSATPYWNGSACSGCTLPCLTCVERHDKCLSCSPGSNYQSRNFRCIICTPSEFFNTITQNCESCNSDEYYDGSVCQNCDSTCDSCIVSASNCIDCAWNHGRSVAGSPTCFLCNGSNQYREPGTHVCITCASNQYRAGPSCLPCHANCLTCFGGLYNQCSTCAPVRYLTSNQCLSCNPPCLTCSGSATCLSCVGGFTLSGSSCVSQCATTQYWDGSICVNCTSPCASCETSATHCTSCIANHNLTSNTCLAACPGGQFFNGSACASCTSPCATCDTSATHCTSCIASHNLTPSNTCIQCSMTQTFDGTTCVTCSSPCETCSGLATMCLSCIPGHNISGNTCIQCTALQYWNGSACASCTSPCSACATSATHCTSCIATYNLTSNTCLAPCAFSEFFNGSICAPCTSPCSACVTSDSNCTACVSGFNLTPSNTCIQCTSSEYFSGSTCLPCVSPCQSCTTAAACTVCIPNHYLTVTNTCSPCASNEFSTNGLTCISCTAPCSGCDTAANHCTSCITNFHLKTDSTCISCPNGQYFATDICNSCVSPCLSCQSATHCLSCITNYHLTPSNTCILCASNQYFDGTVCATCPLGCLTCTGPSVCQSCDATYNLTPTSSCIQCSTGQYFDGTACSACDASCFSCTGPTSSDCIKCSSTFFKDVSTCVNECPDGKFANTIRICTPCDGNCLLCVTTAKKCTACAPSFKLKNSTCVGCDSTQVRVGNDCLSLVSKEYIGRFLIDTREIDVNLREVLDRPTDLGAATLKVELFQTTDPNTPFEAAQYLEYSWKATNNGFRIKVAFTQTVKNGYFLVTQVYANGDTSLPMFRTATKAISPTKIFRINNVNYMDSAVFRSLSENSGTVSSSLGSTTGTLFMVITPISASAGTVLQKITNMFQNILFYNTIKVFLPELILQMVGMNTNPFKLKNYFQVDESEINCTPATNYVAHDVSCNLLNNYGDDMATITVIIALAIIVSLVFLSILKKLKPLTFWHKINLFIYKNYGPTLLMVTLEGSNMEFFGYAILNIFTANPMFYQVIGAFVGSIILVAYIVISVVGYAFLKEYRKRLPALKQMWEKDLERDKKEETPIPAEVVEYRKDRQLRRMNEGIKFYYMRFLVEDYRLDLKDIYYMTPLITIAKNFISQIIVISLADKGQGQVYLVTILNIAYAIYYFKASPKVDRADNWISNATNVLFALYSLLVVAVNNIAFSEDTIQKSFGMVMLIILVLIIITNVLFVVFTAFQMIFSIFKLFLCKKADPRLSTINDNADLFDYQRLGKEEVLDQATMVKTRQQKQLNEVAPANDVSQAELLEGARNIRPMRKVTKKTDKLLPNPTPCVKNSEHPKDKKEAETPQKVNSYSHKNRKASELERLESRQNSVIRSQKKKAERKDEPKAKEGERTEGIEAKLNELLGEVFDPTKVKGLAAVEVKKPTVTKVGQKLKQIIRNGDKILI